MTFPRFLVHSGRRKHSADALAETSQSRCSLGTGGLPVAVLTHTPHCGRRIPVSRGGTPRARARFLDAHGFFGLGCREESAFRPHFREKPRDFHPPAGWSPCRKKTGARYPPPRRRFALVSTVHRTHGLDRRNLLALITMSVMILGRVPHVNYHLYPAYPVEAFHANGRRLPGLSPLPDCRTGELPSDGGRDTGTLFTGNQPSGGRNADSPSQCAAYPHLGELPYRISRMPSCLAHRARVFAISPTSTLLSRRVGATLSSHSRTNLFYAASAFPEPLGQFLALLALSSFSRECSAPGMAVDTRRGRRPGIDALRPAVTRVYCGSVFRLRLLESRVPPWRDRTAGACRRNPCAVRAVQFPGHGARSVRSGILPVTGILSDCGVFPRVAARLIPLDPVLLLAPPDSRPLAGGTELIAIAGGTTVAEVLLAAVTGNAPVDGESLGVLASSRCSRSPPPLRIPLTRSWRAVLDRGARAAVAVHRHLWTARRP
jgi:hypothetical protein